MAGTAVIAAGATSGEVGDVAGTMEGVTLTNALAAWATAGAVSAVAGTVRIVRKHAENCNGLFKAACGSQWDRHEVSRVVYYTVYTVYGQCRLPRGCVMHSVWKSLLRQTVQPISSYLSPKI